MTDSLTNLTRDSFTHAAALESTSSFDFDHINTIWEANDWQLERGSSVPALASASDSHSLAHSIPTTRSPSNTHSIFSYHRRGGIHFLKISGWQVSWSRRRFDWGKWFDSHCTSHEVTLLFAGFIVAAMPLAMLAGLAVAEWFGYAGR